MAERLEDKIGVVRVVDDRLSQYVITSSTFFRVLTSSNLNDQEINIICSVHSKTCMLTEQRIHDALLRTVFHFVRKMDSFTSGGYDCVFE